VPTTVASFAEPWKAHILRGRLEAEGIFALIVDEGQVGLNWPWAWALGGVKVQVLGDDRDGALEIVRRGLAGDYRHELEAVFGPIDAPSCPQCRADLFTSRRPISMRALLVVMYLYFGVIFPVTASIHRCGACGNTWRDDAP
jgi:hypothetical protein